MGVNYADRFKEKHQPEGNINVGAQGDTPIASDLQYGLVDLGFAGVGKIPSWYVPGAVARYMTFSPNEDASYLVSKAWQLSEKITTAYAMADIDTVWGVPVRGNVGVQMQRADQSSSANVFNNSAPVGSQIERFTDGKKYTDVLPSLNLAFSLTEHPDPARGRGQAGRPSAHGRHACLAGVRRGHLDRQAGRQRRQPAARSVACECVRPVLGEVLRRHRLRVGRGLLQEADQLHLHPDPRRLRLQLAGGQLRAGSE